MATSPSVQKTQTQATAPAVATPNAQGFTTPQQMSAYASQLYTQEKQRAAEAANLAAAKLAPQGTVYNPATGTYQDPLSGTNYVGSASTTGMGAMGAGQPGISQTLTSSPQPGMGGLRFQTGTANALTPTGIPNLPAPTNLTAQQQAFTDARLSSPTGSLSEPTSTGVLSSSQALQEQKTIGTDIAQTQASGDKFWQDIKDTLTEQAKTDSSLLQQQREQDIAATKAAQQGETATQAALEFKLGRTGTLYGDAEMQALASKQRAEISQLNLSYAQKLNDAQKSLSQGLISLAKEQHASAVQDAQLAIQKSQEYRAQREEQQKLLTQNIDDIAKSGVIPSEEWLSAQDRLNGRSSGTTLGLIKAAQSKQAIDEKGKALSNAKTQLEVDKLTQELKSDSYTQLTQIDNLRKGHPFGEAFQFGGNTYYGTDTSTVEIDKDTGIARQMYVDEKGVPRVREIGKMTNGSPDNLEVRYHQDGTKYFVDKKTNQPIYAPSVGGKNGELDTQALIPAGSKGGECPTYVRNFVQIPTGLYTVQDKINAVNIPKTQEPQPGYALFTSEGSVGHVAFVTWVGKDEATGKTVFRVSESNRDLKGTVGTHQYFADNPKILGYGAYPMQPGVAEKLGIEGAVQVDRVAAKEEAQKSQYGATPGGLVVGSRSPFLVEGMNETQHYKAVADENDARIKADQILSGDFVPKAGEKDAVVSRAMQIAKENGYTPEGQDIQGLKISFEDYVKKAEEDQGMTIADRESLRPAYDANIKTLKAFDAALKNQAGGITPQRFKTFSSNVMDAVNQGDFEAAKDRLMTGAFRAEQAKEREKFYGVQQINNRLGDFQNALDAYIADGGNTGLFSGTLENMAQKIGKIEDRNRRTLAAQMQTALIDYRQSVTGAAFTESEARMYDQLFPGITKSPELNHALIQGLQKSFTSKRDDIMRQTLGGEVMDAFAPTIKIQPILNPSTGKMESAWVSPMEFASGKYKIAK